MHVVDIANAEKSDNQEESVDVCWLWNKFTVSLITDTSAFFQRRRIFYNM